MFWKKMKRKIKETKKHITIGEAEIENGDPQSIIEPLWWTVSIYDGEERYNKDLEKYSLPQRYIFAIQWYAAEVKNGGHDQFYYNSTGIVWKDALAGFKEIGHEEAYEILKESANRLGGSPSMDRSERQKQLDDTNADFGDLDCKFYEISDLDEVIMEYIKFHKKDFLFDGVVTIPGI
ncbi:MAG TPA: DMP19 family protein [Clostridiales bacterium]|nr:DMP19 family protein [Clostridiales bacterium]